ncbi:hypothetical protein [Paraburkholderia piptadeniae]|uniref:hypothetical protein n=1 Tax=Paraburkholderia piptadeniae TaxID=1701573 RepID=UPI00117FBEEF|nr:hypothetical protein [Paraburkholderia piptadeniae]
MTAEPCPRRSDFDPVDRYQARSIERHSFYGADTGPVLERQHRQHTSRDELARHFANAATGAAIEAEWRDPAGASNAVVPLHVQYADLVVVSQPDPDDPDAHVAPHFAEYLPLSSDNRSGWLPTLAPLTRRVSDP